MENKKINEKELENVSGGTFTPASEGGYADASQTTIPTYIYGEGQKVTFRNPNNPDEVLTGIIQNVSCSVERGIVYRIVVCNSEMEAEHMAGRPYSVLGKDVIGLA